MSRHVHEIRDPIHGFIRLDAQERKALDSRPLQRLRHIHQLAMTYLLYPGATHRRFDHSLGVMELAGRVFDVITHPLNVTNDVARAVIPVHDLAYWRRAVRMAALFHDTGHLPFSHAAEAELLPTGWDHERLTDEVIRSEEMRPVWEEIKVFPRDVAKLALGPKKFGPHRYREESFTLWEAILAEVIMGDAFGVDRMDYLLRDAHHAGVAYGRFDHFRLVNTLRILPEPRTGNPALGVEEGGLHAVEALLLARYAMYSEVYFHQARRIYDYHLTEFLKRWLPGGLFPTATPQHLARTDNDVCAALEQAALDPSHPGHRHAARVLRRGHFRLLYCRNSLQALDDLQLLARLRAESEALKQQGLGPAA
jgi:HD superfamily phosphohydrolase